MEMSEKAIEEIKKASAQINAMVRERDAFISGIAVCMGIDLTKKYYNLETNTFEDRVLKS